MSKERIAIIIREIQYWKEHKLLPEEYCDFLLALYTNGEGKRQQQISFYTILQTLLLILLLPFSFLVIYFTKFHLVLQLGILLLFLSYVIWCFMYYKRKESKLFHVALVITFILILLTTVFISNLIGNSIITNIVILANFLFWIWLSKKNRWNYLNITATIGIVFTILYNVL